MIKSEISGRNQREIKRRELKRRGLQRKVLKRRMMSFVVVMTVYLILFLFSLIPGASGKAIAETKTKDIRVYVDSIVVKEGDTLWSIAQSYHSDFFSTTKEYVEAIKKCNRMTDDVIYAGSRLAIPYTERKSDSFTP